jgi:hypothetical protein
MSVLDDEYKKATLSNLITKNLRNLRLEIEGVIHTVLKNKANSLTA